MTNMPERVWFDRQFRVDMGQGRTLIATAQIHQLGNQEPYFSVTAEQYTKERVSGEPYHKGLGYMESGGMLHDDVEEFVPELQPYLKWHLTSVLNGPMHYIANSMYHFKTGSYGSFDSTAVMGAVKGDELFWEHVRAMINTWNMTHGEPSEEERDACADYVEFGVCEVLQDRLPRLIEAFRDDMVQLFGEEVSKCWQ